jgi:hypothetical protein
MHNLKFLVAILFNFLLHNQIFSQDSLLLENLNSNDKKVLIVGIENNLKFDSKIDNILVNAENVQKKGSFFKVRPTREGPISIMLFSGNTMIGSVDFEAKFVKLELQKNLAPIVKFGCLPGGGKVTVYDLLNNLSLKLYQGSLVSNNFEIVSFDCLFIPKKGDVVTEYAHTSPELNKNIVELIKKAVSGDLIILENLKLKGADGHFRKIPGLSYQVK